MLTRVTSNRPLFRIASTPPSPLPHSNTEGANADSQVERLSPMCRERMLCVSGHAGRTDHAVSRRRGRNAAIKHGAAGPDSIGVKRTRRSEIENLPVFHYSAVPRMDGDNCRAVSTNAGGPNAG